MTSSVTDDLQPTATSAPFSETVARAMDAGVADTEALAQLPQGMARYELGREIGRGGMGRILEATDLQFGRRIAVKAALKHNAHSRKRFVQEALVTANLEHPGIPPVYERGVDGRGNHFYAMRFVEGRTLSAAISAAQSLKERLELLPLIVKTAQTVAYAHDRGVVHRDIKPDNILVGRHGEATLLDWGIAKVRGLPGISGTEDQLTAPVDAGKTRHGSVIGTPYYMAPEQAKGNIDQIDERTDVFALGALLYQLLAGTSPYRAPSLDEALERAKRVDLVDIAQAAPDAPPSLTAIVRRAMAADPADRYATAGDMAHALESTVADSLTRRESPVVRAIAGFAAVFGVVAMTLAVGFIFTLVEWRELGAPAVGYVIWPVIGAVLSVAEIVTRGRYKLLPLMVAFMIATALSGIAGASTGLLVVLHAVDRPDILSDAEKWRTFMTLGSGEALGHIPVGCTLVGLQAMLWAVAKWRNERGAAQRR